MSMICQGTLAAKRKRGRLKGLFALVFSLFIYFASLKIERPGEEQSVLLFACSCSWMLLPFAIDDCLFMLFQERKDLASMEERAGVCGKGREERGRKKAKDLKHWPH
jgi:hypothetical protein